MTSLNFLFRKPRFPIIIDTGDGLLGAKSWAVCEKRLATITFPDLTPRDVIDSTAEGFTLHPEHMAFSPLTSKKRWTKAAIIELYNSQKGPGRPEYPTTSLGNKSLEKVVVEIVELLMAKQGPAAASVLRPASPSHPNVATPAALAHHREES
ncbi:hypothetical protein [Massilia sp. TWR1-2-2]|uniref:hypothetical protein n=1 Tax=Massilia sp. TWR1-2-2 TaxID=2804584 RepID=UPI003CF09ED9